MDRTPVIVSIGRSAVLRAKKQAFCKTHPVELCNQVVRGVLAKIPQLDPNDIEDLILGCSMQYDQCSQNMARLVVQRAELPNTVCGQTVNRFCASSLQTMATAMNAIEAGQGDVYIAGGVENMSMTYRPYPREYQDDWLAERDDEIGGYMPMGITGENVAKKYDITRLDMEKLALRSHTLAAKARDEGKLAPSIIPLTVKDPFDPEGKEIVVDTDGGILNTSIEKMEKMKTCFIPEEEGGRLTAALCSQVSDAASFAVIMTMDKANELGIKPIAKMLGFATAGVDGRYMGLGPIKAVPKALKRAGMTLDQMEEIELNEAFASQAIACIRELGLNMDITNPYGGAMALGHPNGATGIFLTCKCLDYLRDNNKKYGLVTMCIGGGMGGAAVFERLN